MFWHRRLNLFHMYKELFVSALLSLFKAIIITNAANNK